MWESLKKSLNSPDSYVSLALGLAVVLVVGMITFNYFKSKTQPGAQTEQTTESTSPVPLPAKHTVKANESLWTIAETYYKDGYKWGEIAKANSMTNADSVEVGQVLTIPEVKASPSPSLTAAPTGTVSSVSTEKRTYTVKTGDSLWSIAVANYQNGYKWSEIARANKLTNPDIIHPGNVLELP